MFRNFYKVSFKHVGSLLKDLIGEFFDPKHSHEPYSSIRLEDYNNVSVSPYRRTPRVAPPADVRRGIPASTGSNEASTSTRNGPATQINRLSIKNKLSSWVSGSQMKRKQRGNYFISLFRPFMNFCIASFHFRSGLHIIDLHVIDLHVIDLHIIDLNTSTDENIKLCHCIELKTTHDAIIAYIFGIFGCASAPFAYFIQMRNEMSESVCKNSVILFLEKS